ncbi:MAG: DUF3868 domain-containing protein [Bacteroides sp.]|nr:DUF3868 domain-containing protein [Bacteroides sp.]
MKKNLLFIFVCLCALGMYGQTGSEGIRATDLTFMKASDGQLNIQMNLQLARGLDMRSNQYVTLTPVIRGGGQERTLPDVYVYGRKREIVSERNDLLPLDAYRIVRRNRHSEQNIPYQTAVPYEAWMRDAQLYLEEDWCGCDNRQEEQYQRLLAGIPTFIDESYVPRLRGSYIVPEKEIVKNRFKESSAFIDFPVNRTELHPDFRNNPAELARIRASIEDSDMQEVSQISIHGYASPEGGYANNARLAQGRAETLRKYIIDKYNYPMSHFTVTSTPEDWVGFRKQVVDSDLAEKDRILAIIDSGAAEDVKEQQLKQFGATYTLIIRDWFPALRRSDYRINYIAAPFTAEEARRVAVDRPQNLSLYEFYEAAQLAGRGTDEYNYLTETAVRMFPDDPVANLNAASMEIERGNVAAARRYMQKAPSNTPQAILNMGNIALLEGNYDEAEQLLKRARAAGVSEATHNINELNRKRGTGVVTVN